MTTSTLVYSTDGYKDPAYIDPQFEEDTDACLGSQGVISTSQCVRISLIVHGVECPLCVL